MSDNGPLGEKEKEIYPDPPGEAKGRVYRLTYSGEDFRIEALANQLMDMSFFDIAKNEADFHMSNYAKQLLQEMGVFPDPQVLDRDEQLEQAKSVVRALLTVRRVTNGN